MSTVPPTDHASLFARAIQFHQAGQLREAEALYRQILSAQPTHAEALHHLGLIAHQLGRSDLAVKWIQQALAWNPRNASAHFNLGEALRALGQSEEAMASFRCALQLQPNHFQAWTNLGSVLRERGRFDEAIAAHRRAMQIRPGFPSVHFNLGNAWRDKGRPAEAAEEYQRAIELKPDFPEAHNNLGNAFREQGSLHDAFAAYQRALDFKPDYAEAHNNLGNALRELGRLDEAASAYTRALNYRPEYAEAHNHLGTVRSEQGNFEEAAPAFRRAVELRPAYVEAWNNLGVALVKLGQLDEAVQACRRALESRPGHLEARNNLGGALLAQGRLDAALAEFREALRLHPRSAWVQSNIVYALQFHPRYDDKMIAAEAQEWNRQFGQPSPGRASFHRNERNPERRLRVGYVSPYLRDHVVGRNLLPLFLQHERRAVEIYCYSDVTGPDALTAQFRQRAEQWRHIAGLSDDAVAQMIREDGVDILVDLTLHMDGNRLPVFVQQPAPVQVSFAGYPASTGVEAIAYRIGDPYLEAKMDDRQSESASELRPAEHVLFVDSFWCYQASDIQIAVNALPARTHGCVTFGSLNNFCKINEPLLRLWAQILSRVKDSRLILLAGKGSHRQDTLDILRRDGIESHRVEFVELLPRQAYLEQYHRVDIVLDTFPYNGHTTSLDALWMGVPVVSLVGERSVSRAGLSQLSNLGHAEWTAFSEDEYVEIAVRLSEDFPRLAELRATLRTRMEAATLMDAPRFARGIESAYRAMWRRWCAQKSSTQP
jgi:predicted O-linked N-acetylglucosamine transferase (SPINDLY family)